MKINAPYYSQFLDIDDQYCMPRACGIVCLKMLLDFYGKETPPLLEMCRTGQIEGGYGRSGWFHDYFIRVAQEHGLSAHREESIIEEEGVAKIGLWLAEGNPVIVSVIKWVLGQKKFHMVLLVGSEENEDGSVRGFYFHEPEATEREKGSGLFVDIDTFKRDWRKMAIFIKP